MNTYKFVYELEGAQSKSFTVKGYNFPDAYRKAEHYMQDFYSEYEYDLLDWTLL